jgi:hypothetical protein
MVLVCVSPRVAAAGALVVGGDLGSDETVTIDSGSILTGLVSLGYRGNGTLIHSGGMITATSEVELGHFGAGTYIISESASLQSRYVFVKYGGAGAFIQNGGKVYADQGLSVSFRPHGAAGGYVLNDGTLITGTTYQIYSSGTFVGPYGNGTFVQNGGWHQTSDLWLGWPGHGLATYSLNGGVLKVTNRQGGFGTFLQSGGTYTTPRGSVSGAVADSPRLHELSGGAFYVGTYGTGRFGTFRQTGGTISVNDAFDNDGTTIFAAVTSWAPGATFTNRGYATFASDVGSADNRTLTIVVALPSTGIAQAQSIVTFDSSQHLSALRIDGSPDEVTRLDISPGGDRVVVASAFNVQGVLNLNDNALIWGYSGTSPIESVRAQIASARNLGGTAWQGRGIGSAMADEQTLGIGYAESVSIAPQGTWRGEPVDDSAILAALAYYGDTDLNGSVDTTDLGRLASHWQGPGTWFEGDFDYSGVVDVNDLGLLAGNWRAGIPATEIAALGLPQAPVPEPLACGGWLVNVPFLRRRHRSDASRR